MNKLSSRPAALLWLGIVIALFAHQIWLWTGSAQHPRLKLNTDILTLLPTVPGLDARKQAEQHVAEAASRKIFIILRARSNTIDQTRLTQATLNLKAQLAAKKFKLAPMPAQAHLIEFYQQHLTQILTNADYAHIQANPTQTIQNAIRDLYQPVGLRVVPWQQDPFGTLRNWFLERGRASPLMLQDGYWQGRDPRVPYTLIMLEHTTSAFAYSGQADLHDQLEPMFAKLRHDFPGLSIRASGIPVIAEAVADQANREISIVGVGSMLGVIILMWVAFRSWKPICFVALSLLIGTLAAISVCALVFGEIHVLTLAFGASLVGVAEDYGIHIFALRSQNSDESAHSLVARLKPALWMAMLTSLLGYLAFAIVPFPGLRQMAVFSATGLFAAFITVLLWFPWLIEFRSQRQRTKVFSSKVGDYWVRSYKLLPRLSNKQILAMVAVLVLLSIPSYSRLHLNDDIRILSSIPPDQIAAQKELNELLKLPSPTQFFLLQGESIEQILQREERLTHRLHAVRSQHPNFDFLALSAWIPSQQMQQRNAELLRKALAQLNQSLLQQGLVDKPLNLGTDTKIDLQQAIQAGLPAEIAHLWLGDKSRGYTSVVMLKGLEPALLNELSNIAQLEAGITFIDKTAYISTLLGKYRTVLMSLLIVAYGVVWIVLALRFKSRAWRALLPTLLASWAALIVLALSGQTLQIFNILALILILGMGVDYGIFLLEHPEEVGSAWFAVSIGAATTLLSFGLLGLSQTPALASFGITMALGITLVWLLAPMICHASKFAKNKHEREN